MFFIRTITHHLGDDKLLILLLLFSVVRSPNFSLASPTLHHYQTQKQENEMFLKYAWLIKIIAALMGLCTLALLGGGIFKWQLVLDLPIVGTHPFLWALGFALGTLLIGIIIPKVLVRREAKIREKAKVHKKIGKSAEVSAAELEYFDLGKVHYCYPSILASIRQSSQLSSCQDKNLLMSSQTQPLPHNGLFIRRNSAFGTKLSSCLKELIAQGVMVEQQNIRFDDFVAMKTSGIPSPTANHALAVSHGIAAIPAYQQRDNRATHYLEIALKTAEAAPVGHLETQAPPVNYIFVVDVSVSMRGEKLDTVKASIRELFGYLRPSDVIGVIAFDNKAETLLESTPKQNISPDDFGQIINRLIAKGSTDINLALSISIDEMRRYRGAQRVNQLFLFSDGEPTSGETNWIKIRQNIAAKLRQNTATDGNIRLSTFAFGADANKVELDKLAGITGGQSTFVIEPEEDVRDSLQQELDRRSILAAINVQMQINIDLDIEIVHFYGHDLITDPAVRTAVEREAELTGKKVEQSYGVKPQPDLIKEDKGIRVFVPNLAAGETYWVVFELAVPEQYQSADFGNARVQYFDTFARRNEKHPFDLSSKYSITSQYVRQYALGLWTSEVASYALFDVEANDLATAEKRIGAHISVLETARSQLMGQTSATSIEQVALIDDIITLNKFLSLAQNMNQGGGDGVEVRNYLNYGLGELDRVRNGFVYRTHEYSKSQK
jgi:uncharacterized protein YegL